MKDGPISASQLYSFVVYGGTRTTLKDMPLKTFVGGAKDFAVPAYFDFNTMDCPFDVRIEYFRPYEFNRVHELERSVAARKPFLDWLSTVTLRLNEDDNNAVVGDSLDVRVSCGQLDL